MAVFEFPFNAGVDESVDRILAPSERVRVLNNGRLARDGRIEVRRGYTALSMGVFGGGTLLAYDLAAYQDDLIAFGATSANDTSPSNIFSRVNVGQAQWQKAPTVSDGSVRFNPCSDVRTVWAAKYGLSWSNCDVAYANGHICVVHTDANGSAVGGQVSYVEIFRSDTQELVLQDSFSTALGARVVGCGTSLILVVLTTGNALQAREFTTGVDTAWGSPTTLTSNVTASLSWDLENLEGTTDYLVAYSNSSTGNLHVRRYSNAHVQAWENTQATIQGHIACAGATGENVVIAWVSTAATSTVSGKSVTAAGGVNVQAASVVFSVGTASNAQPRVRRQDATRHMIAAVAPAAGSAPIDFNFIRTTVPTAAFGAITTSTQVNVGFRSKLFSYPGTNLRSCGALGPIFEGGTVPTPFMASGIFGADSLLVFAKFNHGFAGQMLEGSSSTARVGAPSVPTDGAGSYWALCDTLDEGNLGGGLTGTLQLVSFKMRSTERRDWAEMQGALYIAGGHVTHFDGRDPVESGFLDAPIISAAAQNAAGGLTLLATYNWVAVYEWYDRLGRVHRSAPSSPFTATLTGANNGVVLTVSTPRSARRNTALHTVRTVVYRTIPNDGIFFRISDVQSGLALTNYADMQTVADGLSDATAITRAVLYTQSQTTDAHFGAQPAKYLAAGRDRIILGGLPDAYGVQLSKLPFPGEPIQHGSPNAFKFQARLNEPVTAVATMGDTYLAFTADAIYEIPGNGPQRNGQGEFNYPRQLYSDGGCINHLSLCVCADGLWFQEAPDKLSLFNGQTVEWAGRPVRDTLKAYPNIKGATLCSETQEIYFACQNTAGDDGVLLVYDLARKVWTVDPVGVVQAIVEYGGRLALVIANVVQLQDTAVGSGAMPTLSVRTGSIRLFTAMGRGNLFRVGLLGTYRGDCTAQGYISYDDGLTWTVMGASQSITSADYAADAPVQLQFDPIQHDVDRFAIRFDITGGSNTGAMRLHAFTVEADSEDFLNRRPARDLR